MAAYLSIRHKETGEVFNGRKLIDVDNMMCAALGVAPDPEKWFMGWMDWAGFAIAVRFDKTIADALSHHMTTHEQFGAPAPEVVAVCQWLIDTFENESYRAVC